MSNSLPLGIGRRWHFSVILPLSLLVMSLFPSSLNAQLSINFADIAEPDCYGQPGGSVRAVAVAGTAPYSYTWNDGTTEAIINDVLAGTYSVTVVDAAGAIASRSITILDPDLLEIDFATQECTLPLSVTVVPTGAAGPYKYYWSTGSNSERISPLSGLEYCVTVTYGNDCGIVKCITLDHNPPEVNVQVDDITCPGDEDASITANPIGGTAPFTYLWSTGATGPTINNLSPGSYTVTLTDAKGCTDTAIGNVAPKTAIEIGLGKTDPTCVGETNGSVSSSVGGGTPPYNYAWNTGATTQAITGLGPGTYTLTVTDANACPDIRSITLDYQSEISIGVNPTPETCPDANDGFLTVTVNNAVQPYTYTWDNGATTQVVTDVVPGTYTVTVTDGAGCQDIATATVNPAPDLEIEVIGTDVTSCEVANGSAAVSIVSGAGPFTYLWSTGAVTASVSGLTTGTYGVTVSNFNQCTTAGTVTISEPPALSVGVTGSNAICPDSNTGTVTATASGGTAPYFYVWSNGSNTATINNLSAGTYSVTVTDASGCSDLGSFTINETTGVSVSTSGTTIVCGEGNTGSARALAIGDAGPFSFVWSTGAATQSILGLGTGTYTVTATDANGCTDISSIEIRVIDDLDLVFTTTDVDCPNNSTGSATAAATGGDAPYTYLWSTGASGATISNLSVGIYSVTATDANGCNTNGAVEITEPTPIIGFLTTTNPLCNGESDGTINLEVNGGTAPYTYSWDTGASTEDISGLAAGTYSVTITDANNCFVVRSATVGEPPALELVATLQDVFCNGGNEGAFNISIGGGNPPYTFLWNNGATTASISGLTAGDYSLTITDSDGCTIEFNDTISEPPALGIDCGVTEIACNGASTGAIDITVAGGSGPYQYNWSNGATTEDISGLSAGTYEVTVSDRNGCTLTDTKVIEEPAGLNITFIGLDVICIGEENGAINLSVSGGTTPYTYNWSNGATTEDLGGLAVGTYTVTVTDANNCSGNATIAINNPIPVEIVGQTDDVDCNGGDDGAINVSVTGGTAPYTYNWSNGFTTEDLADLVIGTYTLTVSDASGCTDEAAFTITEPAPLDIDVSLTNVTCNSEATGSIDLTLSGGTLPYTYSWSNGDTTEDLSGVTAGTYTASVTDANGCTISVTNTIGEPPALTCEITKLSDVINGNDGSLGVAANGGTAPYTFLWSSGQSTAIISGINAGEYTATITDANGCTTSCAFTLTALAGLGNFVWEDISRDGIQDDNEPPLSGLKVYLKDEAGIIIDSTVTDINGFYSFVGLQPATYSVQFIGPDGFNTTKLNIGDDALDSDADVTMNGMTTTVTLSAGEFNPTLDAGFYNPPGAGIFDPCDCLNNSTTETDGQFKEEITIRSYPNETWTIIEQINMFIYDSDAPPVPPIPVIPGVVIQETEEPGVYKYLFKLVDEFQYTIVATNGFDTLSYTSVCEYPIVNVNEIPASEACIADDPIPLSASPSQDGTVKFYVNDEEVTVFDPSAYELGAYEFRVEFIPTDPNECITTILQTIAIVDDCLAQVGDLVWHDQDRDGIQGINESGIEGVEVILTELDETARFIAKTTTDKNGMYIFTVPPGTYKVTFEQPEGFMPTQVNLGDDDALDSDADPDMALMTQYVTLGNGEINLTLDAGFYVPSTIAIADPCTCLNNPTNEENGQFSEKMVIRSSPGQAWQIIERTGMYLFESPDPPGEPIEVPEGTFLTEVDPGVYEIEFKLVDETLYSAIATITNGMDTLEISNICIYPTINMDQIPPVELCVGDDPIPLSANPSIPGTVKFYLDGTEITVLDPSNLELGTYEFLAEFTPDNTDECLARIINPLVVTSNCLAKLGDYVWHDINEDGIQDPNEPGIAGVKVTLTEVGESDPYVEMTTTDHTGMYMFRVPPGDYKVTFEQPDHFLLTIQNAGSDDELDSDVDPVMLMTQVVTLDEGDMNLSLDAGFIKECINVTDPGAIGYDQYLCGPGNDPEPFVSLAPAIGGEGAPVEYLWMYSTEDGPFNANTWTIIPGSNSLTYDAGPLYETTRFARCARREGCPSFLETTIITVLVGNDAYAEIFGQSTICQNVVSTYEATGIAAGAEVEWDFGPGAQPRTATGSTVYVKFPSFGTFTITMTVTENDCTSSITKRILVTNNPALCGEGFIIDASIIDEASRSVQIDWNIAKGTLLEYTIEYAEDGVNFSEIGIQNNPTRTLIDELEYEYTTFAPKQGRSFYRVKMSDGAGNEWYSNEEEVIFYNQSRLALLYPNPASERAVLEIFESFDEDIELELVTISGQMVHLWKLPVGSKRVDLDLSEFPTGMYLLRLRFGDTNVKGMKLIKY